MNISHIQQRKEVNALDADVPLLRPTLIRSNVSELRMLQVHVDRVKARHCCLLGAAC